MEGYRSLCRHITDYRTFSEDHRRTGMLAFTPLSAPVPNLYRGGVALRVTPPQGSSHRPWTLGACLRSCSLAQAERGSLLWRTWTGRERWILSNSLTSASPTSVAATPSLVLRNTIVRGSFSASIRARRARVLSRPSTR